MKKDTKDSCRDIAFTGDNPANIRKILACHKNILLSGIQGVGKITNTLMAVRENTNVYYIGNPVDYEGKLRPGSYEKYQLYIRSLKEDIKIVGDIDKLFDIKDHIILIVDEIYGRSDAQLKKINKLLDMENIQVIQIAGCMKYAGSLIDRMDFIVKLHHDGAFVIDKEFGKAICRIFG